MILHAVTKDWTRVPKLPDQRLSPPKSKLGRWLEAGGSLESEEHRHTHRWYSVLWLTGVDYFSTLGYQPGIALLAAGVLSPLATLFLIGVTLFGALPVYAQVASRSYAGQGSIAMLENQLPGWSSKIFVLLLLGFAATDFVITMTLSAADAAQHALENPYLHPYLGEARVLLTIGLLALLAVVFLKGFQEAIGLAAAVAVPYLLLNLVVLGRGLLEITKHPELLANWRNGLSLHGDWTAVLLASAIIFPRLALGMSGFETGVAVMPLIEGGESEARGSVPTHRIRATRKLLAAAALIMSVMLLLSSFVTSLLISADSYRIGGPASGRAVAYLAHEFLGTTFGTVYDISTIVILWFAGASAMAGLLHLVPRYLPRFGMAPRWVAFRRPLVLTLFFITIVVTLAFNASVEGQGAAYATGVLVLILSAAVAVTLALWREAVQDGSSSKRLASIYFGVVSVVLVYTLIDNVYERPDGVIIASIFILAVIIVSAISRWQRATEFRVLDFVFADRHSGEVWLKLCGKRVHLVPLRTNTSEARARKLAEIRKYYSVEGPIAFVHVHLADNRSEFLSSLRMRIQEERENYVIDVHGANALANTIAYISESMDPISIFLGLTRRNLMGQAIRYLLWGEGETGLMVYTILVKYWEWTPEDDVRPLIFMMSE
jgi:hypothetical protein